MIRKWPSAYFRRSDGDLEKYWRRKNITLQQGKRLQEKTTLPASIGMETRFWSGEIKTRYKTSAPTVQLLRRDARQFSRAQLEPAAKAGCCLMRTWTARAMFACWAAGWPRIFFRTARRVGEQVKIDGINYAVVGVLEPKGGAIGGDQDNFAVVPLTTGLNRYGRWNRSLNILVQARDQASYDATRRGGARAGARDPQRCRPARTMILK